MPTIAQNRPGVIPTPLSEDRSFVADAATKPRAAPRSFFNSRTPSATNRSAIRRPGAGHAVRFTSVQWARWSNA
jgi:hypothetical protein